MSFNFGEKTWPEIQEYVEKDALIILPVGEIEEHSLYLPVDTDARIASFLASEIANEICDEIPVLVLPTIWSGYTPNRVCRWPGCIQLQIPVFTNMVHDICASIVKMGFNKLIMLDCHGQHHPMLNNVTKMIADEYNKYFIVASPFTLSAEGFNQIRKSPRGGVSHAGEWEASMIMHMNPELVHTDLFTDIDRIKYHSNFVAGDSVTGGQKVIWSSWGLEDTTYGALGDPTSACKETAEHIMCAIRKNFKELIQDYYNYSMPDIPGTNPSQIVR